MDYSNEDIELIFEYAAKRGCSDIYEVKQYYDMTFPQKKYDLYLEMLENDSYNIIGIDTRTTGIEEDDELLKLSVVDKSCDCLFDDYFLPVNKTNWRKAEKIHHISPNMVKNKLTFESRITEIQRIINDADLIVGYNILFDINNLRKQDIYIGKNMPVADVMRMFAPIYAERRNDDYYTDYKWQKLNTCASYYFGKQSFDYHTSLADVEATMQCFRAILTLDYKPFKTLFDEVGGWDEIFDYYRDKKRSKTISI